MNTKQQAPALTVGMQVADLSSDDDIRGTVIAIGTRYVLIRCDDGEERPIDGLDNVGIIPAGGPLPQKSAEPLDDGGPAALEARKEAAREINDPTRFPPLTLRYLAFARQLSDIADLADSIRDDPDFPEREQDDPEQMEGDVGEMLRKAESAAWAAGRSVTWSSKPSFQ